MPQSWFVEGRWMNHDELLKYRAKQNAQPGEVTPKEIVGETEKIEISLDENPAIKEVLKSEGMDTSVDKKEIEIPKETEEVKITKKVTKKVTKN